MLGRSLEPGKVYVRPLSKSRLGIRDPLDGKRDQHSRHCMGFENYRGGYHRRLEELRLDRYGVVSDEPTNVRGSFA